MTPTTITNRTTKTRDSGIELLKIFAILLVIISHTVQTLASENPEISYQNYVYDISSATTNIQTIILTILQYSGSWGNTIFFISSAWFLLKSSDFKKKKWFFMLVEIWTISVIILAVTFCVLQGELSSKILIKSLFPTIFENNWYLTCYLLFYPIHPILNKIIKQMNQITLFRVTFCLSLLYIGFNFIKSGFFFPSRLILWVTIYFIIAYMQLYMMDFANNVKYNIILFILGITGYVGIILLTNFLGLYISFFSDKMLHWASNCNPFIICMSISMLNLARNIHFKNHFVNYISSLSLLIYIIHENLILRTYFRPAIYKYIYETYGYQYIIAWIFILVVLIFIVSTMAATIYERVLQPFVKRLSDALYEKVKKLWFFIEATIFKLH